MNLANLIRRCYYDILEYREYIQKFPYEFREIYWSSPLNIERRYHFLLMEILPDNLWKDLGWMEWKFPNEDYNSIDDFIIKNNLEE